MADNELISGFSKMDRKQKTDLLSKKSTQIDDLNVFLQQFHIHDEQMQQRFESFSENTLSNYHLPWGIVPNVMVDGRIFHVPVVIEESSVVAAASKAASFWAQRGGFQTLEISTRKKGQLHFAFYGKGDALNNAWPALDKPLREGVAHITANMEKRGGGITNLHLKQIAGLPDTYYQIDMEAETADSMGANFINSILEEFGRLLPELLVSQGVEGELDVIMAILSNHTPHSRVRMKVEAPVDRMQWRADMSTERFAERMQWASEIAWHDTGRAVTHNKGIYNGVDAVVLATGNDFRAVEAAGHAWAARSGQYRALSRVQTEPNIFTLELDIPMALGTVGGLTRLHPLAAKSLEMLGQPDAKSLMKIAAAVGLANNFAAMASLVTTGIQQGHMKMHLQNILNSLNVDSRHHAQVQAYFAGKTVSVSAVREFVDTLSA